jgi:vacuolar-type H+-ATPase subunit H
MVVNIMVKVTIEAIRRAEQQADQLEKAAAASAKDIIADAHTKAREAYEKTLSNARALAQAKLEESKQQGRNLIANALRQAEKESESLKQSALKKEQAAIDLILSEII